MRYYESREKGIFTRLDDLVAKLDLENVGVKVKYHKLLRAEGGEQSSP